MNLRKLNQRVVPIGINLLVVLLSLLFEMTDDGILASLRNRMEWIAYDIRFGMTLPVYEKNHPEVVIIDIDERSLQKEGRWPWPRTKIGRLVDNLVNDGEGVAVIAFDMVFAEPEDNVALRVRESLPPNLDQSMAASVRNVMLEIAGEVDGDQRLAKSLAAPIRAGAIPDKRDIVLGYVFQNEGIDTGQLGPGLPANNPDRFVRSYVPQFRSYTANVPVLQQAAKTGGTFNAQPDDDGIIRRYHLFYRHDEKLYPSIALEAVRLQQFITNISISSEVVDDLHIVTGVALDRYKFIPTDEAGAVYIPYRGRRGSFDYISATDVLNGRISPEQLIGRIALIGTTAVGLFDLRSMPLESVYPGVEVHANVVAGLLDQNFPANPNASLPARQMFLHEPDWAKGANIVGMLVLGLIFSVVLPFISPLRLIVYSILAMVLFVAGNLWLWTRLQLIMPLAVPLVMIFLLATTAFAYGYTFESRGRHRLKDMFGQYVPPELVDEMSQNPESFGFEGEKRELTVLFSDIRGFTTLSESLSASELKDLLNRFFTPMTEIIFNNRGTIDKYVGDMIMAFWGAPVADELHARHAIQAALDMLNRVKELKKEFVEQGLPEISIGVGINTGIMNVGNMGSEYRRSYTVLGDSVNLGSRLEGLTKFYGVDCIIGEQTREGQDEYLFRRLDLVRVKGKKEPVMIFEPIFELDSASDQLRNEFRRYEEGLDLYLNRQWNEAHNLFDALRTEYPRKQIYRIYTDRAATYRDTPPPGDWDGVFVHTSK